MKEYLNYLTITLNDRLDLLKFSYVIDISEFSYSYNEFCFFAFTVNDFNDSELLKIKLSSLLEQNEIPISFGYVGNR